MRNKHISAVFICLIAAALLAVKIDLYDQAYAIGRPVSDAPVFVRFLGEGRSIVSSLSVLQADRYFHGGVEHIQCGHEKGIAIAQRDIEHYEQHKHESNSGAPGRSKYNILLNISRALEITDHVHLHGDQLKEIIPWLYYAAEIDPHNERAYVLTGFYLCDRLGKVDQAIAFLRKGLSKNPGSWEINAELGRIYFEHVKNYEVAEQYLSRAWILIQGVPHDKFQERPILAYLTKIYEALGKKKDALFFYRRLDELFPKDIYDKKVEELSKT